ncbi:hypothetical protein ACH5RR_010707 [Cinchona calisaya]|uniref:Uncharacterized protein n=1 Tax=Cinchona calisaya TaxID=153742 RepID=A0ABD3AJP7_9GENT
MVKESPKTAKQEAAPRTRTTDMWAVQCGKCFKWRTIPTQEEFEEIRSNFIEDPFTCDKKQKPNNNYSVSCEDPGDIEYDSTRSWVADKPNIPKTPAGFKRRVVMRKNYSKMDVYYHTPTGRTLRSITQVASFLETNPQFKHLSPSDFSFSLPKVMEDTIPIPEKNVVSLTD